MRSVSGMDLMADMTQVRFGFDLPELDKDMTKESVVAAFEKYRLFKYLTFEEREAGTTAGYTAKEHGPTNVTSDQTASIAIHNVDEPARRRAFCDLIERAVKRLYSKERLLIESRYMREDHKGEYVADMKVYIRLLWIWILRFRRKRRMNK